MGEEFAGVGGAKDGLVRCGFLERRWGPAQGFSLRILIEPRNIIKLLLFCQTKTQCTQ